MNSNSETTTSNGMLARDDSGNSPLDLTAAVVLAALTVFSWKAMSIFRFNGLDTPLFLAVSTFCCLLLVRFPARVGVSVLSLYAAWTGWIVMADLLSVNFASTLARDAHWILLPLFVLLCGTLAERRSDLTRWLRLSAAGSICFVISTFAAEAPWVINWTHPPLFGNIRHMAMTIGVLTLWLYADDDAVGYERWLARAVRVLGLALIFWSGGRGAILAVLAALALFAANARPGYRRRLSLGLEVLVALVMAIVVGPQDPGVGLGDALTRSIDASSLDGVTSFRLSLWKSTIDGTLESGKLLVGSGGNAFMRLDIPWNRRAQIFHPHNVILQAIADWGLVGLVLFLAYLRKTALPLVLARPRSAAAANARAVVLFLAIMGNIDGGLYHPEFLLYLGIALGVLLSESRTGNSPSISVKWPAFLLVGGLMALHAAIWAVGVH